MLLNSHKNRPKTIENKQNLAQEWLTIKQIPILNVNFNFYSGNNMAVQKWRPQGKITKIVLVQSIYSF